MAAQTYELWFKQILHEIDSVCEMLGQPHVPEKDIGTICERLHRVTEIQRVLVQQLSILETMSPMGFLTFRDVLFPASGFQSVQWRILENRLGLPKSIRLKYGRRDYKTFLKEEDAKKVAASEDKPSLLQLLDGWLQRAPVVKAFEPRKNSVGDGDQIEYEMCASPKRTTAEESGEPSDGGTAASDAAAKLEASVATGGGAAAAAEAAKSIAASAGQRFDFWKYYSEGLEHMFSEDERHIKSDDAIDDKTREELLADLAKQQAHFRQLFDPAAYEALRETGERRLSYKAFKSALLIMLHHDAPVLQQPKRLLQLLVDIDELSALWRQRHAIMVHRMLGAKMGTGGSSGYHYLRSAAARHKVFTDLFDLSTFLVPKQALPPLPKEVDRALVFAIEAAKKEEQVEGGEAEAGAGAATGGAAGEEGS